MPGPRYFEEEPVDSPTPDYFGGLDRPKTGEWRQHEKDIAKRTGASPVPASGSLPGAPGDTMGSFDLSEGKLIHGAGGTIRAVWLRKLVEQALSMNRRPVLQIRFALAELPVPQDWVLIPAVDYDELQEHAGGHR